nr:hypothetical protein [Tanacetum cinerariifolium]
MDTLSKVSEYLNNLETVMKDGGDSTETRIGEIKKSKEEVEMFEALEHKSIVVESNKHKVVIFTKSPPRAYGEPFMRKMVREVRVEIHGFNFLVDFAVIDYANEEELFVVFRRDFLMTTKCKVDFGLEEMRVDITMLEEYRDIDDLFATLVEDMRKVGDMDEEVVNMRKANKNKIHNVNKLTPPAPPKEEDVSSSTSLPTTPPFRKKEKERIIERSLPKKLADPRNFVLPVHVNGTTPLNALADTGASAMGQVKNGRIQIGYQAYTVDFLVLDILIDRELPLLLGRPFLRTCGALINMGRSTLTIDDEVIRHTHYLKPRAKPQVSDFDMAEDEDWLSCFEVGRDEGENQKYDSVALSFLDIKDEMERALVMEAYFTTHFVFKKLTDFLSSLFVQLKNTDWGSEGYYKGTSSSSSSPLNSLIAKYAKRNVKKTVTYNLKLVTNEYLKGHGLPLGERHVYNKRSSMLQQKNIGMLRTGSRERCQKLDLWLMSMSEEGRFANVAWILAEYLCKKASGIKENSENYGGHYVTKIAKALK